MKTRLRITITLAPARSGEQARVVEKFRLSREQDSILTEIRALVALILSDDNCSESVLEDRQRKLLRKLSLVFEDDRYDKIRPMIRRMFSRMSQNPRLNFLDLVRNFF